MDPFNTRNPDIMSSTAGISDPNDYWPLPIISLKRKPNSGASTNHRNTHQPYKDPNDKPMRNPAMIERANLLNMAKLCIKSLIESSLQIGRTLENDHHPLQQFFVVMEHIFEHGLIQKKTILGQKKEFWTALELIEKIRPEAREMNESIRNLPNIKTPLGRGRAWLRLALMQKKLSDYFKALIDSRELLSELYEPYAVLFEEEGSVIGGLLVGLNIIDCNLCFKGNDLDNEIGVIDFSLYLKDGNYLEKTLEDAKTESASENGGMNLKELLDQKNYLEELNEHLKSTVANLQNRVDSYENSRSTTKEELAGSKNSILELQEENRILSTELNKLNCDHITSLENVKEDLHVERQTYKSSQQGLDRLFAESKDKLQSETQMRLDVEKELELQISMKQEMELAMKLMEKDIHDKTDTSAALRKQLNDVKAINVGMYNKLQSCEGALKHKTELVAKLEEKTQQMVDVIKQQEQKQKQLEQEKTAAAETARKLGQQLADKDTKLSAIETDLRIEREWRSSLQADVERDRVRIAELGNEIEQMTSLKREFMDLQKENDEMKLTCREQEDALSEMGAIVEQSQLKMDDMMESQGFKDKVWTDDSSAANCQQCNKTFSVARRRHHCRNCGDIFCHTCSDNYMPLASSAKPVRVCDNCQKQLLKRYTASC